MYIVQENITLRGPIFPSVTILRANKSSHLSSRDYVTKTGIIYVDIKSVLLIRF